MSVCGFFSFIVKNSNLLVILLFLTDREIILLASSCWVFIKMNITNRNVFMHVSILYIYILILVRVFLCENTFTSFIPLTSL